MNKIIVFGIGKYYKYRKDELSSFPQVEILAFTDNNPDFWDKEIEGIQIIPPTAIMNFSFDAVLIMSIHGKEIKKQLLGLGIDNKKITFWEYFCSKMRHGRIEWVNKQSILCVKRILIITCELNYNGGSIAALNAALAIKKRGYDVVLATCGGNEDFIKEIIKQGIEIVFCSGLPYIYAEEKNVIQQFDIVIVNTFQMIVCACEANMVKPTVWWIHEPIGTYKYELWKFSDDYIGKSKYVTTCAVSKIAKNNFDRFMPVSAKRILHYGIPDVFSEDMETENRRDTLVFAIIGTLSPMKGQDIFIKAAERINSRNVEFWIIGKIGESEFGKEIVRASNNIASVRMFGLLTREEIYKIYPKIDVVVSASREDCLPIVMTEGMMFGKPCIVTDVIGTADYISNEENGFVIPANDVLALENKIKWIIEHPDQLEKIGINARKTYEQYFSLDVFGENFEKVLIETEEKWKTLNVAGMIENEINKCNSTSL